MPWKCLKFKYRPRDGPLANLFTSAICFKSLRKVRG